MTLRILLVAPEQNGIDSIPELRAITAAHQTTVMNGKVTVRDVYQEARQGAYHVIHWATHAHDRVLQLSAGETLSPEDLAQIGRMAGAQLMFFNSCRSGLLASYAVAHGIPFAVYANVDLPDAEAWKMPSAFYHRLAEQATREGHTRDYAAAFVHADNGLGLYGFAGSPKTMSDWHSVAGALAQQSNDLARLRHDVDRVILAQRLVLVWLALSTVLFLLDVVLR